MRTVINKILIIVFLAALIVSTGCQEAQTPSEKQSRIVAARNIELQKQLAARDKDIENLKVQYAARLGLEQKKLADCKKKTDACQEQLKQNRAEEMDDMLVPTLNKLAELRDENEKLKARIKELEAKVSSSNEPAKQE